MKIGNENRNKLIVAVVLMVVAAGLLAQWLFSSGGSSSAADVPPSVASVPTASTTPAPRAARGKKVLKVERTLDPTVRLDLLRASEDIKYQGKGRNIFRAEADIPKPIAPPMKRQEVVLPPEPTGPPPPPPINLKFYGFASGPGEPKKIFLSQGDDVFIAKEGDIVDRRYKVLQISPTSVEVEDVLTNNRQSIPLTQS
jgi:hypothetical protein